MKDKEMSKISEKNSITLEEMEQLTKCLVEKRNQIFKLQDMVRNCVLEIKESSKELVNKTFNNDTHTVKLDDIYIWNGAEVSFKGSQFNKKNGKLNNQMKKPITSDNIITSNIISYFEKNDYNIFDVTEAANSILDKADLTEEDLEVLRWIRLSILIEFPHIVVKQYKEQYKQCLIRMCTEENIGSVEDIDNLEFMANIKDVNKLIIDI